MTLKEIESRHDGYIDALIARFEAELLPILSAAKAKLQARLQESLVFDSSKRLLRSAKNSRAIRKLDQWFMEELDKAGYNHLISELVDQFPDQFHFFQETLTYLSGAMKTRLPEITWSADDLQVFKDFAANAREGLIAVMETVAATARNRILFSIGGMKFADLVATLATALDRGVTEATGLAETATATFYRVIADRGYRRIEKYLPTQIRYRYYGPLDKLTRPFCRHLLTAENGKRKSGWTRPEIDRMDNGQIPNVWLTGGGWRCRHQWILATEGQQLKTEAA